MGRVAQREHYVDIVGVTGSICHALHFILDVTPDFNFLAALPMRFGF